jgi:translocation protein SEC63
MGGMKFEYDENGAKFTYFLISFYGLVILPCTYFFWPRSDKKKQDHPEDISCFEPCIKKNQLLNKGEPKRRLINRIKMIVLLIGWIIFIALIYKATTVEIEHKEYDPFVILGIDKGSSDKEIKKQYRELSKTMHPDKGGDEDKFREIAKAYQALTDEETKKNWEKYGNPDGPGVTQFGIALPKWIVDGNNSYIVLGFYVFIFMIVMPTVVVSCLK